MSAKILGSQLIDSHQSYKAFLNNNNPNFNQRIQKIIKKSYDDIKQMQVFVKDNLPTPNLFYFYAQKYDSRRREDIQEFMVREIDHFLNNYQQTYAVVYVHHSIFDFLDFRKMIEKWPEHFYSQLRRIYILAPSFMVKIVQTFSYGTFYRLCDQIFLNTDNKERLQTQDKDMLTAIGQKITPHSSLKNSIKLVQNQLFGKNIEEYDLDHGRYPLIMLEILCRLVKRPQQLQVQGIFRKSCDSQQLQRLQNQVISKIPNSINNQTDIFVVAGLLKKILNNLREPLFNYTIYNKILNFDGGDECQLIRSVLASMQYVNSKVFVLLVIFFEDYIIAQKQFNKMSAYNLAVIFGPCFFRPKEYDLKDLIYSGKFAKVLVTIFEKYYELIDQNQILLARSTLKAMPN